MPTVNDQEIEVKFLGINPETIEARLVKLGATKQFDRIFKRHVFDYPDLRLNSAYAYLRLRDEGDKITLTFKQRLGVKGNGGDDEGMKEVTVEVSDFEKTADIFRSLGFIEKFYEENRRISYIFQGIEFDIDFLPLLDPYLEIEANSQEDVDKGIRLLELNLNDAKVFTAFQIYERNGINELDYQVLTLDKQIKK